MSPTKHSALFLEGVPFLPGFPLRTGFAEISLVMNAAPTGGSIEATPRSGVAALDTFLLESLGWTDDVDDLPLQFSFHYVDGLVSNPPLRTRTNPIRNVSAKSKCSTGRLDRSRGLRRPFFSAVILLLQTYFTGIFRRTLRAISSRAAVVSCNCLAGSFRAGTHLILVSLGFAGVGGIVPNRGHQRQLHQVDSRSAPPCFSPADKHLSYAPR